MDDDAIKLNLVLAFNFAYDLDLNYADPKYIQMPRRWMRRTLYYTLAKKGSRLRNAIVGLYFKSKKL